MSLEKEIRELKTKNRTLVQRVEELSHAAKPPTGHGAAQRELVGKLDDPYIQSHVKELNNTIGKALLGKRLGTLISSSKPNTDFSSD